MREASKGNRGWERNRKRGPMTPSIWKRRTMNGMKEMECCNLQKTNSRRKSVVCRKAFNEDIS